MSNETWKDELTVGSAVIVGLRGFMGRPESSLSLRTITGERESIWIIGDDFYSKSDLRKLGYGHRYGMIFEPTVKRLAEIAAKG
jgi:hypothetical protein